jgi:hypothetical protein
MAASTRSRSLGEEAGEIAREAGKRARRQVVERSQSRLNRSRHLLASWEKKPGRDLAFFHIAQQCWIARLQN